jgi:hypothetical protein
MSRLPIFLGFATASVWFFLVILLLNLGKEYTRTGRALGEAFDGQAAVHEFFVAHPKTGLVTQGGMIGVPLALVAWTVLPGSLIAIPLAFLLLSGIAVAVWMVPFGNALRRERTAR